MQRFGSSASLVITSRELLRQTVFRPCDGGGKYGCWGVMLLNPSGKLAGWKFAWTRGRRRGQLAKPSCRKDGNWVKKKLRRAGAHASSILLWQGAVIPPGRCRSDRAAPGFFD